MPAVGSISCSQPIQQAVQRDVAAMLVSFSQANSTSGAVFKLASSHHMGALSRAVRRACAAVWLAGGAPDAHTNTWTAAKNQKDPKLRKGASNIESKQKQSESVQRLRLLRQELPQLPTLGFSLETINASLILFFFFKLVSSPTLTTGWLRLFVRPKETDERIVIYSYDCQLDQSEVCRSDPKKRTGSARSRAVILNIITSRRLLRLTP